MSDTWKIQRPSLKAFLAPNSPEPSTKDLFLLFNEWISVAEDVFVDVADYSHIHQGPRVFLNGFYKDYIWDEGQGKPGLMVRYRQPQTGSNMQVLSEIHQEFMTRLESFSSWFAQKTPVLSFNHQTFLLREMDRSSDRGQVVESLTRLASEVFVGCTSESWGSAADVPGILVHI